MRALPWLAAASLFAGCALAQHPGGAVGAPQIGFHAPALSSGLPPISPIPPLGHTFSPFPTRRFPHSAGRVLTGFPYLWGGYGESYYVPEAAPPEPPPQQPIVIVQPVQREIVRPEIHEYSNAGPSAEPMEEPPAFSVALLDGTVRMAAAVAVQGDALVGVDPDNGQWRIALGVIDRDTTRRLNRAKGLDLRLPPPPNR